MGGGTKRQQSELAGLGPAVVAASEQAKIGISVVLNEAGVWRREYVNRAAAELLGYEAEELLKVPPAGVFSETDQARIEAWRQRREQAGESTPSSIEVSMLRKDGTEFNARLATSATAIGKASGWVDFFFDGGDRERATRDLESAEARFRRLLDAAPDAITVATDECVVYVNPGFMRMLGWSSAAESSSIPRDAHVHPDDRTLAMERVSRARERGETKGFMKILVDRDSKQILGASFLGLSGDEVVHSVLDVMYAKAPYTVLQRAVHIHPTVSELIPTMLGELQPLAS